MSDDKWDDKWADARHALLEEFRLQNEIGERNYHPESAKGILAMRIYQLSVDRAFRLMSKMKDISDSGNWTLEPSEMSF